MQKNIQQRLAMFLRKWIKWNSLELGDTMKRFGLNDFVTVKGNLGKLVGQVGAYMQPTGETLLVY